MNNSWKKLLCLYVLILSIGNIIAQPPNSIAFPSVNNTFLGSVGANTEVGVDLYTGTAQINIPICNINSKELTIPVFLSYTGARGIKVQDYSSCIGIGWQLNAGGGISRVVRGYPDEYPNGYLGTGLWGQNVANSLVNNTPMPNQITGWDGSYFSKPTSDGEPDIFFVKTPFFSFQFSFDEYGSAVFSNSVGIKITHFNFYNSSNYFNASFKVIDDTGNQYFFGSNSSSVEKTTTKLYEIDYTIPTTWYLDKIITYNSSDVIQFDYITSANNTVTKHTSSSKSTLYNGCTSTKDEIIFSTTVQPKHLSRITSSLGYIDFTYVFDRRDITNAARLNSVKLKTFTANTSVKELKTYEFKHGYFGDPTTDLNLLRLRLDKITIAGNTPSTQIPMNYKEFAYNQIDNLPSRITQSFDYWGYYNYPWRIPMANEGNPMDDPTLREPTAYRAKSNILTNIKNLGGSSIHLEYELNNYYNATENINVAVGGLRVKTLSQKLVGGENIATNYYYSEGNGNSSGQILTQSYKNLVWVWPSYVYQVLSEAPSNIYDLNGNFVGYTKVKVVNPYGGYTISTFTNFDDFPDEKNFSNNNFDPNTTPNVTSLTSRAYKRGLLKKNEIYTSSGNKISEEINEYISLNTTITKKCWAFKWYSASYNVCSQTGSNSSSTSYSTLIENYRLDNTIHRDYDQHNTDNFVEKKVYLAYADNKRLIKAINSSSSKTPTNINQTEIIYYADDAYIPMITPAEQTAISNMLLANCTGVIIHKSNYNNGALTQVHNSYLSSPADNSKVFLDNSTFYKDNLLVKQQLFTYDHNNSNIVSSKQAGGKYTSIKYGYNNTYPIAKTINASSFNSFNQGTGSGKLTFYITSSVSFKVDYTGTISLNIGYSGYPGSGYTTTINYNLSGPSSRSGTMCSTSGGNCNGYLSYANLTNITPGNYTLSYTIISNNSITTPYLNYIYPKIQAALTEEFYYEGFEQVVNATIGEAHTGQAFMDATSTSFNVNYAFPNNRSYIIQWWNLQNGKWVFNEEPYTGVKNLTGVIDDVRIFPEDAQMTSYTYNPLIGITGEIDASGRTITYEYDGLGRKHIERDNEKNILSVICYDIQGKQVNCKLFLNQDKSGYYFSQNCPTGQSPVAYYVNVPGNMFSSYTQEDADALATQYGQNQANLYGTCYNSDFPLYTSNYSGNYYTIELYNVNTGQWFWFQISSYGDGVVGYIPEGTYDIYLYSSYSYNYQSYYAGCSYYTSGYGSANFYNVYLNSSCNTVSIY